MRASGAEALRDLEGRPDRRAGGAADEQPFLAREPARGQERVAVGDADPLVDDVRVHRLRPRVLADALDEVRVEVALVLGRVDRALGVGADDQHLRLVLLEVAADAGDRAARADGDHDRVDVAALGLLEDLGRRHLGSAPRGFAMFEYWSGLKPPGISSASRDDTE